MSFVSETMQPLDNSLDFNGNYSDFQLLRESPHGKLYTATRAGKRFIMKAPASDGGSDIALLKREYEMSLSLSHPGIAYVFTYEAESEVGPCLVMEYVDGRSLRLFLNEKPSFRKRRKVFAQILDAVEYLHNKGLVHNDLSPENILITHTDNDVKLIDFGFADDDVHYLAHSLGGTKGYASEELMRGEKVDARSDIWTLGAIMEDLFGARYFFVSSRCRRSRPSGRYPDVRSLRRAWKGYWAPLWCIAALIILAFAASFANEFHKQKEYIREIAAQQDLREAQFEALKSKVDAWYENELPPFYASYDQASGIDRNLLWAGIADKYNSFSHDLLQTCPKSCKPV